MNQSYRSGLHKWQVSERKARDMTLGYAVDMTLMGNNIESTEDGFPIHP